MKKYEIPLINIKDISYDKQKKLGTGGFAKVFKGRWLNTQDVAIKKYRKFNLNNPDNIILIEGVLAEIKVGVKLNHPKINRIFGVSSDENYNLLVIQELAEKSLADLLEKETNLPLEKKNRICLEITEILYVLKSLKIIHRDLKPQNFLVTFQGSLQVCDFGSIKFLKDQETSALSENSTFTKTYAPPEIMLQDEDQMMKVGFYSDIWSLGCIFYRVYYGKPLWKGFSDAKMMKFLIENKLPELKMDEGCPEAMMEIIKKCLSFNEKKRIPIESLLEEMKLFNENQKENLEKLIESDLQIKNQPITNKTSKNISQISPFPLSENKDSTIIKKKTICCITF